MSQVGLGGVSSSVRTERGGKKPFRGKGGQSRLFKLDQKPGRSGGYGLGGGSDKFRNCSGAIDYKL